MKRWFAVPALISPLIVFFGLAATLALGISGAFESVDAEEGTLTYYLLISSEARSVPRVGAVRDLEFYSSSGDGAKPAMNRVEYSTDAEPAIVMEALEKHARSVGYKYSAEGYTRGYGEHLEFSARVEGGRTAVIFWEMAY